MRSLKRRGLSCSSITPLPLSLSLSPGYTMDWLIRPAQARDCSHIMAMIQELAQYEGISHFIKLTETELQRDGFGDTPWFRCIVAEVPDKERTGETGAPFAGYALFANSYSSWTGRTLHLEDLYVSPQFRGRGLGRLLMKKVAQEGLKSGCSQIHLTVLKWNEPAIHLYRSLGAENLTEEPGYQVMSFKLEALRRMGEEAMN
ncbi:hypothetical protein XELAEV_18019588mg [Xenopus laevis]|uniref:N-acetyltransferase domain-containing protein n=1 Tax=Xenopus laevis TaxID=8355 RepID=A0A974DFF0_XENLA|nr:hypothetical protein XELAEV_18019588mg [Xenopus laevis]